MRPLTGGTHEDQSTDTGRRRGSGHGHSVEPRLQTPRLPPMLAAYRELRRYGYLFRTFFRRDLSARYKASVLGVVWSLLNPLMMMLIYTFVFSHVLQINQTDYSAWFITGFLPWFFFSTALSMGASTLVGHSSLITKVYFPRELLPLSMTAANLVNMGIAYAIFLPYAIYVRGFSRPRSCS